MKHAVTHLLISIALGIVSCTGVMAQSLMVREIITPASPNSGEPNLTLGQDGRAYLTWVQKNPDTSHTLFYSRLDTAGWTEPRTVATGKEWFVNWADFPAMAVDRYGNMIATWLQKSAEGTYAYGVRAVTSSNRGQAWSEPFWVNDDKTETEHGFVSLVPARDNAFHAVWLDGRETAREKPMTLRYGRFDPSGKRQREKVVDSRVCDCCQTSAVVLGDGSLVVAYRDRSSEEVRDISVARLVGTSWSPPTVVHQDGWKIEACPVNGPSIDASGQEVVVGWFTMAPDDSAKALVAWSHDGGQSFDAPMRVDHARPLGRVDVAFASGSMAYVVWLDDLSGESDIMVRAVSAQGPLSMPLPLAKTSAQRDSGFPRIVYDGEVLIVAWTDVSGAPQVKTVAVHLDQ